MTKPRKPKFSKPKPCPPAMICWPLVEHDEDKGRIRDHCRICGRSNDWQQVLHDPFFAALNSRNGASE